MCCDGPGPGNSRDRILAACPAALSEHRKPPDLGLGFGCRLCRLSVSPPSLEWSVFCWRNMTASAGAQSLKSAALCVLWWARAWQPEGQNTCLGGLIGLSYLHSPAYLCLCLCGPKKINAFSLIMFCIYVYPVKGNDMNFELCWAPK